MLSAERSIVCAGGVPPCWSRRRAYRRLLVAGRL